MDKIEATLHEICRKNVPSQITADIAKIKQLDKETQSKAFLTLYRFCRAQVRIRQGIEGVLLEATKQQVLVVKVAISQIQPEAAAAGSQSGY